MLAMGNITLYILLMCAIQHCFANHDTKGSENIKLTEKYLEDEAAKDIEHVLINIKDDNQEDSGKVEKNIYETSLDENYDFFKKQIDDLLKQLDLKKRNPLMNLLALRSDHYQQVDDLTPSARYKQFIKNLDLNHRDTIKSRPITVVGENTKFDRLNSNKNNLFDQIMKKFGFQKDVHQKDVSQIDLTQKHEFQSDESHKNESKKEKSHKYVSQKEKNKKSVSVIKNESSKKLKFIDKTLRQGDAYANINPDAQIAIHITNDENRESEEYLHDQHKSNQFLVDENKVGSPVMRVHNIPKSDNYDLLHNLLEIINFKQINKINTSRENLYDRGNLFWKQEDVTDRERKSVVPVIEIPNKMNTANNDHIDQIVKQMYTKQGYNHKLIQESLGFSKKINTNNHDGLSGVIKRQTDIKYREDISGQYNYDDNWPGQKLSTNRFEDTEGIPHHTYWQTDEQQLGTKDINESYDLLNPDNEWQKLLERFNINLVEETSDVLHPKDHQEFEKQSNVDNEDWNVPENLDFNYTADNHGKPIPDERIYRTLHTMDDFNNHSPVQLDDLSQEIQKNSTKDIPDHHGRREKRSAFTQAGYTHDPDTCKLYNENLVKLWANLSKHINATEQPNERALHNIAMIIQAYLEHQNLKQFTGTYKVKHEGARDKVTDVTLKIKQLVERGEDSPEKITKIITKYIKPYYGDEENQECQRINEESLGSSVVLVYKNYLENAECQDEGDNVDLNLRKLGSDIPKVSTVDWHSRNTGSKAIIKSILSEDELYKDFHKGKILRQRNSVKKRSNFRGSKTYNAEEKLKPRVTVSNKSSKIKLKKRSYFTSDNGKRRCERYAIRKLTVSLRPIIERFMALLDCQIDNTLRSLDFDRVKMDPYYLYGTKFYSNENSLRQRKNLPRLRVRQKEVQGRNNRLRKFQDMGGYDTSNKTDKKKSMRKNANNVRRLRKYRSDKKTRMKSSTAKRYTDTNDNNDKEYVTDFNEYFQSPPLYDDYEGVYKTHSHSNEIPISTNKNENVEDTMSKMTYDDVNNNLYYYEDFLEEQNDTLNGSDQQIDYNNTDVSEFADFTKLKFDEHSDDTIVTKRENMVTKLQTISNFLRKARDSALETPEFAVPFALNTDKGYVELTHLIKYPKMLVYRPQFIVKNTMPYDDFLKTINNFNMTNDDVRLMKIVRHLPDSRVQVLFETQDFEPPLEIKNVNENRRSGLQNYPLVSRKRTDIENANYDENIDFTNDSSEDFNKNNRDGVRNKFMNLYLKPERSGNGEDDSHSDSKLNSESNLDNLSTLSNSALKPTMDSDLRIGLLENLGSKPISNITLDQLVESAVDYKIDLTGIGQAVGSAIGSQLGSGIGAELDTLSTFNLNPINSSHLKSYLGKLLSSNWNFQSDSKSHPTLNYHTQLIAPDTASNLLSDSSLNLLTTQPSTDTESSQPAIETQYSELENTAPSSKNPLKSWWKKWKNVLINKIKVK